MKKLPTMECSSSDEYDKSYCAEVLKEAYPDAYKEFYHHGVPAGAIFIEDDGLTIKGLFARYRSININKKGNAAYECAVVFEFFSNNHDLPDIKYLNFQDNGSLFYPNLKLIKMALIFIDDYFHKKANRKNK